MGERINTVGVLSLANGITHMSPKRDCQGVSVIGRRSVAGQDTLSITSRGCHLSGSLPVARQEA